MLSVCEPYELEEVDGRSCWHVPNVVQEIISIQDFRGGGGSESLFRGMQFIQKQLQVGAVYVHCKAGKGRSVLMVMAWLMGFRRHCVTSPLDALHVIIMHRPQINPDTIMTHAKVKEAHMFWLEHVMSIEDILKDGVLLVDKDMVCDMETWLDSVVGAGFFSNDKFGYLHARDKLEKYYGGSSKSQELHDLTTPPSPFDEHSILNASTEELSKLWKNYFGLLCGKNRERLEKLDELNNADAFQKIAKSIRKYDTKNISPLRSIRKVFAGTRVFDKSLKISVWTARGTELHGVFSTDASPEDSSVNTSVRGFWKNDVVQNRPRHEARVIFISEPDCAIIIEMKGERFAGVRYLVLQDLNSAYVEADSSSVIFVPSDSKSVFIVRHESVTDALSFAKLLEGRPRRTSSSELTSLVVKTEKKKCNNKGIESEASLVYNLRRFRSEPKMNRSIDVPEEDEGDLFRHQA